MQNYFIFFKPQTSVYPKVMLIKANSKERARHYALRTYGKSVDDVISSSELTQTMELAEIGDTVVYTDPNGIVFHYPKPAKFANTLTAIIDWFRKIHPNQREIPAKSVTTQLGVHIEEFAEMLEAIGEHENALRISKLGDKYKTLTKPEEWLENLTESQKTALADSLADQNVTLLGVGYRMGFDMDRILEEVNNSNWSKFDENGNPIFDENGKVMKGKNYFKPDLSQFISN